MAKIDFGHHSKILAHGVRVTGISQVVGDLKKMEKQMRKASIASAKKGIKKLEQAIRDAAPEDTGTLKKNIKGNVRKTHGGMFVSAAIVIDAPGSHWIPVEFGHSKGIDGKPVPAKPFVYPTRDRVLPGILDEMEKDLDNAFDATGS